ncbi:hypothetical protein MCG98_05895 [Ruminococcus sp. OA3]|uniref:hypothetical protein n=1 Tax=Ruminococcus sp. OA3 TaxID=2914164 RepID=UPI001F06AC64|nr:hypothetical protein [Ruminococcus sp. OA3]MCH1982095.1 hypothetical protein [Ruminococcus sp. OA3]
MKSENKNKNALLVMSAILSVAYMVLDLLLYPYLARLQSIRYIPYVLYYCNTIRVVGIFVVMLFLLLFLNKKNVVTLGHKNRVMLYAGIGIYVIYYLLFFLNFGIGVGFIGGEIIIQISVIHSWILCIPAIFLALGLVKE